MRTTLKNQVETSKWIYGLLIIPFISAVLALFGFGFFFKSGTAGAGILILLFVHRNRLNSTKDVLTIVGAFVFSIAGDWFLSNRNGDVNFFNYGIMLFFCAHVGYLWFALLNGRLNRFYSILILAAYLLFFFIMLLPNFENETLMVMVLLYLLISCFSLGAAIGIAGKSWFKVLYITGIGLILFSDTLIALREFGGIKRGDSFVLPSYYLAHLLITASLLTRFIIHTRKKRYEYSQ